MTFLEWSFIASQYHWWSRAGRCSETARKHSGEGKTQDNTPRLEILNLEMFVYPRKRGWLVSLMLWVAKREKKALSAIGGCWKGRRRTLCPLGQEIASLDHQMRRCRLEKCATVAWRNAPSHRSVRKTYLGFVESASGFQLYFRSCSVLRKS